MVQGEDKKKFKTRPLGGLSVEAFIKRVPDMWKTRHAIVGLNVRAN